jgi:ATP-dependent helicase HrpA
MSATMEADKLAAYFDVVLGSGATKVIEVPGRNHEVTRFEKEDSTVVKEAVQYVQEGENVLIFLPGVREIIDTITALQKALREKGIVDAVLLPLHSKLSQTEQDAVIKSYSGPKIICATNIAQTSITIPDINVVIDSALERRKEIDDEVVQSLLLRPASRADMNQRAGRTGRVAPGVYVHTRLNEASDFMSRDDERRFDYPIPEILRTDVDRNTLIAAAKGIDFYDLVLFHPVDTKVIQRSKRVLVELGAIDENGSITPRGTRMARMPMRPRFARMLIEVEDQGFPVKVRNQAAAMIAALEVGGMPSWLQDASRDWRNFSEQTDSDHLAQLDLFIATKDMSSFEQRRNGFDIRNVEKASELHERIKRRLSLPHQTVLLKPNLEEREQLRRAIASGMTDFLYKRNGKKEYSNVRDNPLSLRALTDRTTVVGEPQYVIGTPYGIERKRRAGDEIEHVIQDVTSVSPELIGSVALAQTLTWENYERRWSKGRLRQVQKQMFAQAIETGALREVDVEVTPAVMAEITQKAIEASGPALSELKHIKKTIEELQHLTTEQLPIITQDDLLSVIRSALNGEAIDSEHLDNRIRDILVRQHISLDEYVSPRMRQRIIENAPDEIEYQGVLVKLRYRQGVPTIAVPNIAYTLGWDTQPSLPDGRLVKLVFDRREYDLPELQMLARAAAQ